MQTNGILQGDPLSLLLFNIATADVIKMTATENTRVYLYADDMTLTSTKAHDLQSSLNNLTTWAEENSLKINAQKSSLMVFRKGGRIAERDKLQLGEEKLEIVNEYRYLEVTFQTSGNSFNKHIRQKTTTTIAAMRDIRKMQSLSLDTAMRIFRVK